MEEIKDNINPNHYKQTSIECIDVMTELYGKNSVKDFCRLNAFKYLYRHQQKGSELDDLKKARWYLDRLIKLLEEND